MTVNVGFPSCQPSHTFASLAQWKAAPGHSSESLSVGFSAKLGSIQNFIKMKNEARDPKSVGFEEDTTHTMFSNLG